MNLKNSDPVKTPNCLGISARFAILCPLPRECQGYVTRHPRRRKGLGKRNRSGAISDNERRTRFASIRTFGEKFPQKMDGADPEFERANPMPENEIEMQYQQYKMNQNAFYFSCETVFAGSLARVNGMTTAGGKFIQTRREGSRSKPGMRNFRQARSE